MNVVWFDKNKDEKGGKKPPKPIADDDMDKVAGGDAPPKDPDGRS